MLSHAFRGAKLLAPLLSPEQPSQQSPEQQQQQPQQPQGSEAPVAKALSLLSWVGSGDKQNAAEPAQEQQQEQPEKQDTASPSDYSALMFVSLLWGSYTPVLRYLYSMDDLLTPQVCQCLTVLELLVALLPIWQNVVGGQASGWV
jgi:hypothetical protein